MSVNEISKNITQHTIVYVVDKQERAFVVQQMLTQAGFRVVLAVSLYDALKLVGQEMPHLIITEAILSDGNAGNLYDKLQQDPILKQCPIMLQILKKTKDELAIVTNRKFAGFYMGPIDQKAFMSKLNEIVSRFTLVSPYFYDLELCGQQTDVTLNIDAAVIGRIRDQLVAKSSTALDPQTPTPCTPKAPEFAPATLRMPASLKYFDDYFNVFPLSRVVGKGKLWIENLKQIDMESLKSIDAKSPVTKVPRRILFCEPDDERFEGFRDILGGYDLELVQAKTLSAVTDFLKRQPDSIGGIYIHDMVNDQASIDLRTYYARMPLATRPPMIIGTITAGMKDYDTTRFIKRPFGLGIFVEMLESTFQRCNNLAAAVAAQSSNSKSGPVGVPVSFQTEGKVIGLDETGGILKLKSPVTKGAKINLGGNPFLASLLGGQLFVQVTACVPSPGKLESWQARFTTVGLGLSKVKYWDKISKVLSVEAEKYSKIIAEKEAAAKLEAEKLAAEQAALAAAAEPAQEIETTPAADAIQPADETPAPDQKPGDQAA